MIKFILRCFYLSIFAWLVGLACYGAWIYHIAPYAGKAEGIVVLTGGEQRIETGLRLLEKNPEARLLISGVNPAVGKKTLLALHPVSPTMAQQIDLGFAARDTLGNADETAQWARKRQLQSLIVVTSQYHMPRALVHLGAELPDVALYPYPVADFFAQADWYRNPAHWRLLISEYDKFLLTYPKILLLNPVQ